jgi:ATP/maltotriose-dependent transcriptional regulator MalT
MSQGNWIMEVIMRINSNDSKKYAREYPYDFATFENNAGANKHDNEILSKITYEPFKKLLAEIYFEERIKSLSSRTQKIIGLILEGYNQHNIAMILDLSIRTIKREYLIIKKFLKNGTI